MNDVFPPAEVPPELEEMALARIAADEAVQSQPALGQAVGRGMVWMVAGSALTKGGTIISFLMMGTLLAKEDVGLATLAFAFFLFTQYLRDGGVPLLLVQRGHKGFDAVAGPLFWMAMAFNVLAALVLAGVAPIAAGPLFYDKPKLIPLLLIMAISIPFATPGMTMIAQLQGQLRFKLLANIQMASALLRYTVMVVAAWRGLGALSYVLPIPITTVFEGIACFAATRDRPWARPFRFDLWPSFLKESKWIMFTTFAYAAVNQAPYFLLGKIMDEAPLGVFAFGYQIVGQIDQIIAATASTVLFSALAKLNDEPQRQAAATLRAVRFVTLLTSILSMGLVVTVGPIQSFVWGAKWEASVLPAQILAAVVAWRILLWVPGAAIQARGQFATSGVLMLLAAIMLTVAAGVGAKLARDWTGGAGAELWPVAAAMAAVSVVGFGGLSLWGLRKMGVTAAATLRGTVPPWLCSAASAGLALCLCHLIHPLYAGRLAVRPTAAIDALVSGTMFCGVAWGLLRLFTPALLREAATLVPARLAFIRPLLGYSPPQPA